MLAKELAAILLRNPEEEVVTSSFYGDYLNTESANSVTKVEMGMVTHWPQTGGRKVVEDDSDMMRKEIENVLIIS
jgi:hypothetical protein